MSHKFVVTTTPTYLVVGAISLVAFFSDVSFCSTTNEDICGQVPIYQKELGVSINESSEVNFEEDYNPEDDGEFRILYGMTAVPGEWPFIARINMCEYGDCRYCTGSLLNSRWIISAGHCGEVAKNLGGSKDLTASIGLYDLLEADETARTVKLDRITIHPNYTLDPLVQDLVLFHLAEEIEFDEFIQPVCLISEETKDVISYSESKICYVVGYGMVEHIGYAVKLQKLQVGVREPDACNKDTMNDIALKENTLCIGPKNEKHVGSSCRGDSGGPNVCYEPETNKWRLFGTVSYGPAMCDREAGDQWLSVATDLTAYRSWILESIAAA